jgi:hypothetical protein
MRSLLLFIWLIACCTSHPNLLVVLARASAIRTRMVAKLVEVKQERNAALLKVIEKEGAIGRLSEQLQSECRVLVQSSPLPRTNHNFSFSFIFRGPDRAGAISGVPGAGRGRPEPGP